VREHHAPIPVGGKTPGSHVPLDVAPERVEFLLLVGATRRPTASPISRAAAAHAPGRDFQPPRPAFPTATLPAAPPAAPSSAAAAGAVQSRERLQRAVAGDGEIVALAAYLGPVRPAKGPPAIARDQEGRIAGQGGEDVPAGCELHHASEIVAPDPADLAARFD